MPNVETPKLTNEVPPLAPRPPAMHKGNAGRVAIVAGSRGMSGAAVLCALGALRGGAGLVRVYCPASIQPVVAASEPCLMSVPLNEDREGRISPGTAVEALDLGWADVLAIGPGLGQGPGVAEVVSSLAGSFKGPTVIDADGLNNLAAAAGPVWKARSGRGTVITPHPGEMARLRAGAGMSPATGEDDESRITIAHEYACHASVTVVLKGHRTVVCTADEVYVNSTGNPGMATGGMGDVLTGLIAALLGQKLDAFAAGRLGVYVHGLAADQCSQHIGPVGYLARDVADAVPAALADASRPRIGFV